MRRVVSKVQSNLSLVLEPQLQDAPRILYLQYQDPAAYPPLEHSSRILAEQGWDVVFLGAAVTRDASLKLEPHPRVVVKSIGVVPAKLQGLRYLYFTFYSLFWILFWRPKWIYGSDPIVLPALYVVAMLTSAQILYHEHDSPTGREAGSSFRRLILRCRNLVGRSASVCVLPQSQRLQDFLQATQRTKPTLCVWNCPRRSESRENLAPFDGTLILYYHGSINAARLPPELVLAIASFRGAVRLIVAGYEVQGSIGHIDTLKCLAAANGFADAVQYVGAIPLRSDLLRYAAQAHVGLSLMPLTSDDINTRHMVGASNKAFDCMGCGLPLLVSDLPEWVDAFVVPGFARACDPGSVESIRSALAWYLENPQPRAEMGNRCREKIRSAWNYESMFEKVLAELSASEKFVASNVRVTT